MSQSCRCVTSRTGGRTGPVAAATFVSGSNWDPHWRRKDRGLDVYLRGKTGPERKASALGTPGASALRVEAVTPGTNPTG